MRSIRSAPDASRAVELQAVIRAERDELPFLVARDGDGRQILAALESEDERLWIGRGSDCDVVLDWDAEVSRVHAELVRVAGDWAVTDDGLSENGTFVAGERVAGRRRLHDGDMIRVGDTTLTYRAPGASGVRTRRAQESALAPDLTQMQGRVLAVLCRPLRDERAALPATNREIADELVLSIEAVKAHMRSLFAKFEVEDLPQNQKRVRVAEQALRAGLVPGRRP